MNLTSYAPDTLRLTADEQSIASDDLDSTRNRLVELLDDLSYAQWHFKPAPDRWSIAETLEHLVLIEGRVHGIIHNMPNAPAADPEHDNARVEGVIRTEIEQRQFRFQAPPAVTPSGQMNPADALQRFLTLREQTQELLTAAPALRGHVVLHPFLGPWDGYQWILAAAAHTARHSRQILECKACPGFPEPHTTAASKL